MKALSIRQPWAWLILNAGKNIENRAWSTRLRGRILIHAAQGMTRDEHQAGQDTLIDTGNRTLELPGFTNLPRGGIVGSVEIVGCVRWSNSPWFFGPWGFVLRNPRALAEPIPWKGQLGFFEVPDDVLLDIAIL